MGRVSRRDRLPPKEPVILFTFASSLTPSAWDATENSPGQAPPHPDKDRETQLVFYIGIARGPSVLVDFGRHKKILRSAVSAVLADAPRHCSRYSLGYGRTNLLLSFGQGVIAFAVADDALDRSRAFQILTQLRTTVIHTLSHTLSLTLSHATALPHPRSHSHALSHSLRQPLKPVGAPVANKCNCVTVTVPPRADSPASAALLAAPATPSSRSNASSSDTNATPVGPTSSSSDSGPITTTTSSSNISSSETSPFPSGRLAKMPRSFSAHFAPTFLADCLEATFKEVVRSARGRLRKRTVLELYPDAPHAYLVNKKNVFEPDILDPPDPSSDSNGASSRLVTGTGASEHSSSSGTDGFASPGGTRGAGQGGKRGALSSQMSARDSLMSELSDMMADFEAGDFGEKLVVSRSGRDDEYEDDEEWYLKTRGQPPSMTTNARGLGIGPELGLGLGFASSTGGVGGGRGGVEGGGGGGGGAMSNSPLLDFAQHAKGMGLFPSHSHSAVFAPMGGRSASAAACQMLLVPQEYAGLVPVRSGDQGEKQQQQQQQQQARAFPRPGVGGTLSEGSAEGEEWEQGEGRGESSGGDGSGAAAQGTGQGVSFPGSVSGRKHRFTLSHTEPSSEATVVPVDPHLNPHLTGHLAAGGQGGGGGRRFGEGHRRMGGSEGALSVLDSSSLEGSDLGAGKIGGGARGNGQSSSQRLDSGSSAAAAGEFAVAGGFPVGAAGGGFASFSPGSVAGFYPGGAGGNGGDNLFGTSFGTGTGSGSSSSSSNPFEDAANRIKGQRAQFDSLFPLQSLPDSEDQDDSSTDRTSLTGPAGSGGKEIVQQQARQQAPERGYMRMRLKSGQMSPMLKGALSVFRSPSVQERATGGMRPATAARISALTAGGAGGLRGDERWGAGFKPLWASFRKAGSGKEKEGGSGKERERGSGKERERGSGKEREGGGGSEEVASGQ
ncbi:hypothetical protein CLOP_g8099 [Closterium sp. NIES-67]|nr:hypothetical protein CLOP_g8099 [Closterium sp. NIES-67]